MAFKDGLQSDLNTFFNPDELAETHKINGRDLVIMPDTDKLTQYQKVAGLSTDSVAYSVTAQSYGPAPSIGEYQIYDGKKLIVFDFSEEAGVYHIILSGYSSAGR